MHFLSAGLKHWRRCGIVFRESRSKYQNDWSLGKTSYFQYPWDKSSRVRPHVCTQEKLAHILIHVALICLTWILIGVLCKRCWWRDFLLNSQASSVVNSGLSTWSMGSVTNVSPSNFVSTMILCRGRLGNLRPGCFRSLSITNKNQILSFC